MLKPTYFLTELYKLAGLFLSQVSKSKPESILKKTPGFCILMFVFLFSSSVAYADLRFVVIKFSQINESDDLEITAKTYWNLENFSESQRIVFAENNIFYPTKDVKIIREYKVGRGNNKQYIRVELKLNQAWQSSSSKVKNPGYLSVYTDDEQIFYSENFITPKNSSLPNTFSPQRLRIFYEDSFYYEVAGNFGSKYSSNTDQKFGLFSFRKKISESEKVDDEVMSGILKQAYANLKNTSYTYPEYWEEPFDAFFPEKGLYCPAEVGFALTSGRPDLSCAEYSLTLYDKKLNDVYKELFKVANVAEKKLLRNAQRAWITLRDSNCDLVSRKYSENSEQWKKVCLASMTDERTDELDRIRFGISNK